MLLDFLGFKIFIADTQVSRIIFFHIRKSILNMWVRILFPFRHLNINNKDAVSQCKMNSNAVRRAINITFPYPKGFKAPHALRTPDLDYTCIVDQEWKSSNTV